MILHRALLLLTASFSLVLLAGCGTASSPSPAAPVPLAAGPSASSRSSTVELPGGGKGYLVLPDGQGKHPAILVIQEWWGLNDWIRDNAARFARQGYVALAVDLYRGRSTKDPGEAHELMRGLPEDRALADLEAGFNYLTARSDVDPQRIGSVGWCMGGGYSLALATSEARLRAAVVNYGHLITAPEKIDVIHAAILGNFAGADRGIPVDDVRAFESQLKQRRKEADIKIYDGKAHAFMNPNNKDGYDAAAANDAWVRIEAFFAHTLLPRPQASL